MANRAVQSDRGDSSESDAVTPDAPSSASVPLWSFAQSHARFCDIAAFMIREKYPHAHVITRDFEPRYIAEMMDAGFLPMAYVSASSVEIPMACLDKERAVMWLMFPNEPRFSLHNALPASRALSSIALITRPRARKWRKLISKRRFFLTIDVAFDYTFSLMTQYHAERAGSWIVPRLRDALRTLLLQPVVESGGVVQGHSIELWEEGEDGRVSLAAGEIGYSTGCVYTAMTGFHHSTHSGTLQLLASAARMRAAGLRVWDLGMMMEYKQKLGLAEVGRVEYQEMRLCANEGAVPLPLTEDEELAVTTGGKVKGEMVGVAVRRVKDNTPQRTALAALGDISTLSTAGTAAAAAVVAAMERDRIRLQAGLPRADPRPPRVSSSQEGDGEGGTSMGEGNDAEGGRGGGSGFDGGAVNREVAGKGAGDGWVLPPYNPDAFVQTTPGVVNGVNVRNYPVDSLKELLPPQAPLTADPYSRRTVKRQARFARRAAARGGKAQTESSSHDRAPPRPPPTSEDDVRSSRVGSSLQAMSRFGSTPPRAPEVRPTRDLEAETERSASVQAKGTERSGSAGSRSGVAAVPRGSCPSDGGAGGLGEGSPEVAHGPTGEA